MLNINQIKTTLISILEILRWNKPSGRLILLIPAGWSLWLTPTSNPDPSLVLKILIGGIFVSGFGCIANDIWDKEFDKKVLMTKDRPLASNKIDLRIAYLILIFLIFGSFAITLSLPEDGRLLSACLAFLALPLIIIYPSAKRWFKFPQAILSICWGFAVLIPWAAHEGSLKSVVLAFCWFATVSWTFGFDTIYSLADKKYDLKLGINSSAINLKGNTRIIVHICYFLTSLFILLCALINQLNIIFYPVLIIISFLMQQDIRKVFIIKNQSIKSIGEHFRNQVIYGSLILLNIIVCTSV